MRHVLFICTGNIFRSLTAEYALRAALQGRDGVLVASAGTEDFPHVVRPNVRDYLREKGFDVSTHRRRTLTRTMLDKANLVVAMSTDHRAFIEKTFALRTLVFLEACGLEAAALPDIEDVIPDYQTNTAAVDAHVRMTIDRIVGLAPRLAGRIDVLLQEQRKHGGVRNV